MVQVYNGLLIPSVNEPLPGRWDARLKFEGYDVEHWVFGSQHLGEHKQQFAIGSERGDESLPESPMFELDITGEVVPMGKNLSHDLRDFLHYSFFNFYLGYVHCSVFTPIEIFVKSISDITWVLGTVNALLSTKFAP
ncbi:hypothetical protein GGTG_13436 [Gaeumannomyces tritici R3-111a-1]|uniref:Uncharacterized protein n=1 Tax=Gaeumannomyces tritici (strain R3-111a-1) TaxID=644352 RepID=J3PIV6_GAET3|nr:hypothetical protein GGTG_13436 [Gaeumannomyces tritici R3-111a-1]EJT69039.1 hypothetical protein GGTG_13436 [Gaeumannomyces tritici R3-111a-1]